MDAVAKTIDGTSFLPSRPPAVGQVDVWLVVPEAIAADRLLGYQGLMSPDEHARWQRFAVPTRRLSYLVARALLRTTLSRYFDVSPRQWQFGTTAHGRPYVTAPGIASDIRFNLSRTDGLVALAVARGVDVGVDVENVTLSVNPLELAASMFDPAEVAALEQSSALERRDLFFAFWTLKEAYAKARGMGLSLNFDGFAFDLSGTHPRVRFKDSGSDDPSVWQFRRYLPSPCHVLAVAVPAADYAVDTRLIWVVPDVPPGTVDP